MSDTVIAPDLRKRYDDLIHRRNQCLMRGNLMQRAEYWMDYEDREVAFIERVSKAEQENVALKNQLHDEALAFNHANGIVAELETEKVVLRAKVAKLEAPVSDEEWPKTWDGYPRPSITRSACNALIAARGRESR